MRELVYDLNNIGPDDLTEIPLGEARNLKRKRYNKTHPDSKVNAKITFIRPNKFWKKHPDKCDVLGFDAKDAPIVKELPKKGLKGQIVKFRGKIYVADRSGQFKLVQKKLF